MQRLEPTLSAIGIKSKGGAAGSVEARFSDSPVNGLLYVRGALGGSAAQPECQLQVKSTVGVKLV